MNNKISVKRIICLLLAVIMLFAAVGCKDNGSKKRVVVRNKIVVTPEVEDNTSSDDTSSNVDVNIDNSSSTNSDVSSVDEITDDQESSQPQEDVESEEETTSRPKRVLINAADNEEEEVIPFDEIHKETFTPEFESENVAWDGPKDYVIVYSAAVDKNGARTNARVLAEKLKTFFKDNDNVELPVYKDTDPALEGVTKMIIVGDTAYYKSSLSETEFAVNLKGDKLVFEGGHIVMVEKAVDWFRTVKREKGKVAILEGAQDDFKSVITLDDGKDYVYVWGDEFDGEELVDTSKWSIGDHMPNWGDLAFIDTEDVCYVENGRLRMTAIRYLSEENADYGWASCGSYDTADTFAYRNGYIEFDAKISYTKGIIFPLWLMSNPDQSSALPIEQYSVAWTLEVDIFETFSNGNQWDVSFHKYYKPYDITVDGVRISNGILHTSTVEDGVQVNQTTFNGEVIYREEGEEVVINKFTTKILSPGWASWGYITSWRNAYKESDNPYYDPDEDKKQQYQFTGEDLETLNDSYHKYGFLYSKEGYKMYIDGECWLEREWVLDWDAYGFTFDNNNGWGYNLWYYLIMNQHPYTPASPYAAEMKIDGNDAPISSFINSVRLYQLPDSIEVNTPAFDE